MDHAVMKEVMRRGSARAGITASWSSKVHVRKFYWKTFQQIRGLLLSLDNGIKPLYCPLQQRLNQGIYAVNIHARIGFFAQLTWCLYILANCERLNLKPVIRLFSPFYARVHGEDWLEHYFENRTLNKTDWKRINNGSITFSNVSDINQLGMPADHELIASLEQANHLLGKYLAIKDEFTDYIEQFVDKHFGTQNVLGIHYRGTDKKSEADPVSREYVAATISNYLDSHPQIDALFVASDEAGFIEWIEREFKQHIDIISHDDTERSEDGKAIHVRPARGDNYIKGKEALINSLLLSKCNALIRTSSFLSAWSSIFNPSLPVIMLNRPFDDKLWFPDALISQNSLIEYLPSRPRCVSR